MTTQLKALLLGATASFALVACGGGEKEDAKVEMGEVSASKMGESPLDKPFKLADAETIDVDALVAEMEGEVTFDSATFDEDLGAIVLENVRPTDEEDGSETVFGRIELYGLNVDAMKSMDEGDGFTEMTELFRKIRIFDVSSTFEVVDPMETGLSTEPMTGSFSIGGIEIDSVKVMGEGGDMDIAPDGVEFGGMAMKDMAVDVPFGPNGEGLKFDTPDFRLMGYKNGVFGGFYAEDLEYSLKQSDEMIAAQLQGMGPQAAPFMNAPIVKDLLFPNEQTGKIGTMLWEGVTFTNMIPYMKSEETPPVSETDLIKVGGMEFLDQEVSVNGKLASKVAKTVMEPIEFHHFMPKKIHLWSEGGEADFTAYVGEEYSNIADVLKSNGLDDVKAESSFKYTFDPSSGAMKLVADGEAKGLYGSSFDLAIDNFDYDTIVGSDDEAAKQGALMGASLKGMTLAIDDEKLVDTIFAVAGAVTEQDPAGLRQQAVGIVSLGAMQGAQLSPRIPEYVTALTTFISDGGTLKISVAPEEPVTFGGIAAVGAAGDPGAVLETLNVTVTQE